MEQYQRIDAAPLVVTDGHGIALGAEPLSETPFQPDISSAMPSGDAASGIFEISEDPNRKTFEENASAEGAAGEYLPNPGDADGPIDQLAQTSMAPNPAYSPHQMPAQPATLAPALSTTPLSPQLESEPASWRSPTTFPIPSEQGPPIEGHRAAEQAPVAIMPAPPSSPSARSSQTVLAALLNESSNGAGGQVSITPQYHDDNGHSATTDWMYGSALEGNDTFVSTATPMAVRSAFPLAAGAQTASATATAIASPPAFDQGMLDQLSTDIARLAQTGGDMNFSLTPISLGQVHVSLQYNCNKLQVIMNAETSEANDILEMYSGQFINEARNNGLDVDSLIINHTKSQQNFSEQRSQNNGGHILVSDQPIGPEGREYERKIHKENAKLGTDLYA
ncbi:MAG: flagellar hook-length control protein FliK [Sphingopyxis sp.]